MLDGGYGGKRAWAKLRLVILARDLWICQWCGEAANTVDHVVARWEGGTDDPANLVACCDRCQRRPSAIFNGRTPLDAGPQEIPLPNPLPLPISGDMTRRR
jgi:5-methylcytosine-specific restriction endonuclease McrA